MPFEVAELLDKERLESVSEGLILIVSDPESGGEVAAQPERTDATPPHEIPSKGTHDAKIIQGDPTYSMRSGEASKLQHRYLPLNVTDRNRIEEFGKQEFFVWVRHSNGRDDTDSGDLNNNEIQSLRCSAGTQKNQGFNVSQLRKFPDTKFIEEGREDKNFRPGQSSRLEKKSRPPAKTLAAIDVRSVFQKMDV